VRLGRRKIAEKQYRQESTIKAHGPEDVVAAAGGSTPTKLSSTTVSVEYRNYQEELVKLYQTMRARDSLFANFGQVVTEYVDRDMTYRLPADHLLSLIYYNVFRAFALK
jgi:hypothetical protein